MSNSPLVKLAKINKNCEGCMALKRAIDGYKNVIHQAINKIKTQSKEIKQLKKMLSNKQAL